MDANEGPQERELKVAQRRMLRKILGAQRRMASNRTDTSSTTSHSGSETSDGEGSEDDLLEPWSEWLKRTTEQVEALNSKLKIDDWVVTQRRHKFTWTGHLLRRFDGRWTTKLFHWDPSSNGWRRQERPNKRWVDALDDFFKNNFQLSRNQWTSIALDKTRWNNLKDDFAVIGNHT